MYKILLVDDEYLEREALKLIITKNIPNICIVGEAISGKEAIVMNEKLNPHIIFMDIKMPGMNGIDASKEIIKHNKNVKIILLTAYDEFSFAQQAIKIGIKDYILKPASPNDIVTSLNKQIKSVTVTSIINDNISSLNSKEIEIIVSYIKNNINKDLSLEKMSKVVNMNKFYLSKLFKKEIGINYNTYVTDQKINKAKELLANTNVPILNIALDLGYKNSNYFSRVFKKNEGINPTEFRKQQQLSYNTKKATLSRLP
jgi:YesN/AraC family two-component response regulator